MAIQQAKRAREPVNRQEAGGDAHGQTRNQQEFQDRQRRPEPWQLGPKDSAEGRLANGLGWFSIGLGLAEIMAPKGLARLIGVRRDHPVLFRLLGVREIVSGVGILTNHRPAGSVWSRVAGDAMDLSLLGAALLTPGNDANKVAGAMVAVLGVTALDITNAQQLSRPAGQRDGTVRARSVTINRPAEELYRFWRDFQNLPRFMGHLEAVRVMGDKRSHWVAKGPAGTTVEWDAEVTEDVPNELIAWRSLADADVENSGSVRFTTAPGGRGTVVRVELEYNPPGGALGASLARLFGEEPEQQIKGDLHRFKQMMEIGEVVYSDASVHKGPHPARPAADTDLLPAYDGTRSRTAIESGKGNDNESNLLDG